MDMRVLVGLNMRKFRKQVGLSQEELAHRAKLDRTYISGVERGVRNPTVSVLQEIATALGIKPTDLLTEADTIAGPMKPTVRPQPGGRQSAPPIIEASADPGTFKEIMDFAPMSRGRLLRHMLGNPEMSGRAELLDDQIKMPTTTVQERDAQEPHSRVVLLPTSRFRGYEVGAMLLAELVFPRPDDDARRQRAQYEIAREALTLAAAEQSWAWSEQTVRPAYIVRAYQADRSIMTTVRRQLERRRIAGQVLYTLLGRQLLHQESPHIPGLSVNKIAEHVVEMGKDSSAANFKYRSLGSSRTVVHVALALDLYYLKKGIRPSWERILRDIVFEEEFVPDVIGSSQTLSRMLTDLRHFKRRPLELTRFWFD